MFDWCCCIQPYLVEWPIHWTMLLTSSREQWQWLTHWHTEQWYTWCHIHQTAGELFEHYNGECCNDRLSADTPGQQHSHGYHIQTCIQQPLFIRSLVLHTEYTSLSCLPGLSCARWFHPLKVDTLRTWDSSFSVWASTEQTQWLRSLFEWMNYSSI